MDFAKNDQSYIFLKDGKLTFKTKVRLPLIDINRSISRFTASLALPGHGIFSFVRD
jgi:hypothetical protein